VARCWHLGGLGPEGVEEEKVAFLEEERPGKVGCEGAWMQALMTNARLRCFWALGVAFIRRGDTVPSSLGSLMSEFELQQPLHLGS